MAWWSAPPREKPFTKPDAYNGGARTHDEALRDAERAAGRPLVVVETRWARAWANVLAGKPAFGTATRPVENASAASDGGVTRAPATAAAWWSILGVDAKASSADIKRAFKKRALETHPDRGGDAETFREVHRAYQRGVSRRAKPVRK